MDRVNGSETVTFRMQKVIPLCYMSSVANSQCYLKQCLWEILGICGTFRNSFFFFFFDNIYWFTNKCCFQLLCFLKVKRIFFSHKFAVTFGCPCVTVKTWQFCLVSCGVTRTSQKDQCKYCTERNEEQCNQLLLN